MCPVIHFQGTVMAQSNHNDYAGKATEQPTGTALNCTEAQSLLRLVSPQANETTYFSVSLLNTPNGGQLYVTPNLFG